MKSDKPQKMTIPCIINILKEYTDEDNTMTQEEIGKKLKSVYGIEMERKSLSRNLRIIVFNYDEVVCKVKDRKGRELSEDEDDTGAIYTDFYYEHMFSKVELQAIIYNIVFAKHIKKRHKEDLIDRLETLVPLSTRRDIKTYIRDDSNYAKEYEELFYNLELLDEVISSKDIIRFQLASYKDDMKLHTDERIWYVFPLGIAVKNNDYYLVGLVCGSKNETPENLLEDIYKLINDKNRGARFLDTFRVDKIRELDKLSDKEVEKRLSETDKKLIKKISMSTFKKSWSNIQDYVSQNSSLYPGRNLTAKIKLYDKSDEVLSEAIDCFGKENVRIEKVSDENQKEGYLLTVDTNDNAVIEFTKTYASCVEVIKPDYLREEILEIFKAAYERMIEK